MEASEKQGTIHAEKIPLEQNRISKVVSSLLFVASAVSFVFLV